MDSGVSRFPLQRCILLVPSREPPPAITEPNRRRPSPFFSTELLVLVLVLVLSSSTLRDTGIGVGAVCKDERDRYTDASRRDLQEVRQV